MPACLGADNEARRYGQAKVGHLGEVGTLAAEEVLHVLVALGEVIDKLRHCTLSQGVRCPAVRRWAGNEPPPEPPVFLGTRRLSDHCLLCPPALLYPAWRPS